jgi:hypothetical protein
MLSKKLAALAAISVLAASPAVAQTAQSLSVTNAPSLRASAPSVDANSLDSRNGIGIYLIAAVVLGLVVWGVIELTKSDDGATSP